MKTSFLETTKFNKPKFNKFNMNQQNIIIKKWKKNEA